MNSSKLINLKNLWVKYLRNKKDLFLTTWISQSNDVIFCFLFVESKIELDNWCYNQTSVKIN